MPEKLTPMRPTVLLFDIDGTLISSGGVARRAIERAFTERYGTSETLPASFGGMTDKAIARDAITLLQPELSTEALETEIEAALEAYLLVLREETRVDASRFRVQPGVRRALDHLAGRSGYAIGLGTGNVRRGAQIKLECVGLYEAFSFGGFGCDHIDRTELLRIGAERGAALLETPLPECRVVVIGDTPKDVAAARGIGAECIAVATGASSLAELATCEPTALFTNLSEPGVLEVLTPSKSLT